MSYLDTAAVMLLIALWMTLYLTHFPFSSQSTSIPSANQDSQISNPFWYPQNETQLDDLEVVINGTAAFGFIFSDAYTPPGSGVQNWCNMPHVNKKNYPVPRADYTLEYVEVVGS